MNLDPLSFALAEIRCLVANLSKKNYRSTVSEINHLIEKHGPEADRHFFTCLLSHIDFNGDGKDSGRDTYQIQLLTVDNGQFLRRPNFVSILCNTVDDHLSYLRTLRPSAQLLTQLSKVLKLNRVQEVVYAFALNNSSNVETAHFARQFLRQKIPDLIHSYVDVDTAVSGRQEGGLLDAGVESLHLILSNLLSDCDHQYGMGVEQRAALLKALRRDFPREPRERLPVILGSLLYPDPEDIPVTSQTDILPPLPSSLVESPLAELMREAGYCCTATKEECRIMVSQVRDLLTPSAVAGVLGMMARTAVGLGGEARQLVTSGHPVEMSVPLGVATWKVDTFVTVVKDLTHGLDWKEVVCELDHPGFLVTSKKGFMLLVQGLLRGLLITNDAFPIHCILHGWSNTEGQLSFISHALHHQDVFCFTDHYSPSDSVVLCDILKLPPTDDDDKELGCWKSLSLVETLLHLSDAGHYKPVLELFQMPVAKCPDVLVLALLQTTPSWNTLKQQLMSKLLTIFLGPHPNSAAIFHYSWHHQSQSGAVRSVIMQAMSEWYRQGDCHDQNRLSRILDLVQDIKAMSAMLNASPYSFVVDLACLASRREYLKLDKWLSDKIADHKEPFLSACVNFLKRRCPQLIGGTDDGQHVRSHQLPQETVFTMLASLKQHCSHLSPEMQETVLMMCNFTASTLVGKYPSTRPNPGGHGPQKVPAFPIGSSSQAIESLNFGGVIGKQAPVQQVVGGGQQTVLAPIGPVRAVGSVGPQGSGVAPVAGIIGTVTSDQNPGGTGSGLTSGSGSGGAGGGGGLVHQDMSAIFPEMQQSFSKEVEDQANSYFQQIYNHPPAPSLSIDQVLAMLKRFKDSDNALEKDIFQCMLRNLFEEYRYFPQYPDRELHTTAVLFGGIIEKGIVTYWTLGIALRYILEGLRKPTGTKMFLFGITALDRFKPKLKEYPQYCQHVAGIPHFRQFPVAIIEYVEYGAQSKEPVLQSSHEPHSLMPAPAVIPSMGSSSLPFTASSSTGLSTSIYLLNRAGSPLSSTVQFSLSKTPSFPSLAQTQSAAPSISGPIEPGGSAGSNRAQMISKPSIATATNIDTLIAGQQTDREVEVPPEPTQDRVFFVFNNLSLANMKQKSEELLEYVCLDFVPWVSQYLVMKRASIEPNFHNLYSTFIDVLNVNALPSMVVNETFRNIKVLLRSDKGVANFSDRTLLKNLGHWLGMITLGKNKPILKDEIDLKSLVYEAYQKGPQELLYVVPFTAKVLESCAKSKVFQVPNPWTMGIMNVLSELHQEHDLKLNLKFEIEVLCKTLNVDIGDLRPSMYLRNPALLIMLEVQYLSRPVAFLPPPSMELVEDFMGLPPSVPGLPFPVGHILTASLAPTMALSHLHAINAAGLGNLPPSTLPPPLIQPSQPPPPLLQPPRSVQQPLVQMPSYPTFVSVNISMAAFQQQLQYNEKLTFLLSNPSLACQVRPTVERTVQELLTQAVDRTIKVAITCCEHVIKKVQAKELLEQTANSIATDVVDFCTAFTQKTAVDKAVPEIDKRLSGEYELRRTVRAENRRYCDPVCLTYQAERMPEQIRMKVGSVTAQQLAVYEEFARNLPGFQSAKMSEFPFQSLPPQHSLPPPMLQQHQPQVLQQHQPPVMQQHQPPVMQPMPLPILPPPPPQFTPDEISLIYDRIVRDLEQHMQVVPIVTTSPMSVYLHSLLQTAVQTRNSRESRAAGTLLQKALDGLLDHYIPSVVPSDQQELLLRFRECHLMVLKGLAEARSLGIGWALKEITRCLMMTGRDESKYNVEAIECLVRSSLITASQLDIYLCTVLDANMSTSFPYVMQVIQRLCPHDINSPHNFSELDFPNTVDVLRAMSARMRFSPESGLENAMPSVRMPGDSGSSCTTSLASSGPNSAITMMQSGITQAREFDDPAGLHEKTEYLLRDWVTMYHSPAAGRDSTKAFTCFVQQIHQQGILKTDDLITRFFRLCTEMCIDLCYRSLGEQAYSPSLVRAKCFHTLDAFVRLVSLLVKHSGDINNHVTKINLLNKVLGIVAGVLMQDHEVHFTDFHQLPYHRIFIMLFIELNAPEPVLENINFQVLSAFCQVFHILRPSKAPGFSFAWMELISHRVFIGRLLALTPQQRGWHMYGQLLLDLFKYLSPFVRCTEISKSFRLLYKGTLRVLLVLLHDFPEFLCDYHYMFCDAIPPNCIQLRNLILSAFPRNMRLPDPFTPNLKVDSLPDITQMPRIVSNYINTIQPNSFRKDLDSYLKTRSPIGFLSDLKCNLQSTEFGCHYNIELVNALVLYVGTQAIQHISGKGQLPNMATISPSSHMDIFQNLAVNLDSEGCYVFLMAMTNHLRYPNTHTHYFSCCLLYLFDQAHNQSLQEQITRVLLERVLVNRPHPWGLLITFIELVKNPTFKFWSYDFVRCAPEFEKLFDTVARTVVNKNGTVMEAESAEVH